MSFRSVYVLILLMFFACSNEHDEESNINLLVSENWTLSAVEVDPSIDIGSTTIDDIYGSAIFPDCLKDDELELNSDGTYIIHNGERMCDSNNMGQTGLWEFTEDENQVVLNQNTDSAQYLKIVELTENHFKVAYLGPVQNLFKLPLKDSSVYTVFLEYRH